jgi:hypothetical protein
LIFFFGTQPLRWSFGRSKDEARIYIDAEGVRRCGSLVTARVPDGYRTRYEAILDRSAINIRERGEAYSREDHVRSQHGVLRCRAGAQRTETLRFIRHEQAALSSLKKPRE